MPNTTNSTGDGASLDWFYQSFNQNFWNGSLHDWSLSTDGSQGLYGQCDLDNRTIRINVESHTGNRAIHATLIHEMAHAAVGLEHDDKWRAEMKRVRALGAPTDPMDFLVPYDEMRIIATSFIDAARSGETDFDFVCNFLVPDLLKPCCGNPVDEQAQQNLEIFRCVFDAEREVG